MTERAFTVQGTEVFVEGQGEQTIVMLHGWPDTHRLWDSTVQALGAKYRCVRFTFPGNEAATSGPSRSLDQITALLLEIVDQASPGKPVTLLLHDWGCFFGYEFAARHPHRAARVVGMDIGDVTSPDFIRSLTLGQKLMALFYQLWLAMSWVLGRFVSGAAGDFFTRLMARLMHCPAQQQDIRWYMNFPYAMAWLGLGGGMRGAKRFKPHCPMLYLYGKRKPLLFHSPKWLDKLNTTPGSKAVGLPCGHWIMLDQPAVLEALLLEWLPHED
jgi:cis-3-alkyl-4-acyloxetan-2-one decarboxylase